MSENDSDEFNFTHLLKFSGLTIPFIYFYVSLLGFSFIKIFYSGTGFNIIDYYDSADFLLIGFVNYKALLFTFLVIFTINIIMAPLYRLFKIRTYEPIYGQRFDEETEKEQTILAKKRVYWAFFFRSPSIILLIISLVYLRIDETGLYVLFMIAGLLYYLILISITTLNKKGITLDYLAAKILFFVYFSLGILIMIMLGFLDKKESSETSIDTVITTNSIFKGEIIGTSRNYIFIMDSTLQVINKDKVEAIEYTSPFRDENPGVKNPPDTKRDSTKSSNID